MKQQNSGREKTTRVHYVLGTCALVLICAFLSGIACGQEASEQSAEQLAKSWLVLVDAGNYTQSWNDVSEYLKKKITRSQWVAQLQQTRAPLGPVKSRRSAGTQFKSNLPGMPAGRYAAVQYTTAFARLSSAKEVVALMLENGHWRVVGYFDLGPHSK